MPPYQIKQNRKMCISCGFCAAICPSNWKMVNGKAKPIKTKVSSLGCNQKAAQQCPVHCIKIIKVKR